jgi:molybdate/tungstate transport system substrate-binding protein
MRAIAAAFEARNPGVKVVRESSGSRAAARKIADLGRVCDVMVSADYTVIDELLMGKHATWNLIFATNEMVVAYPDTLLPGLVPGLDNWQQLLAAKGARVGHADPNSDPCGYRALMVMQLAELESGAKGLQAAITKNTVGHIRPKASDLVALLEVGELDYAFLYRSVAVQHQVPYLELPPSINLGDPTRADDYAAATVDVSGPKPGTHIKKVGAAVAYGVTIPANSLHPELALDFVEFLVQEQHGLKILEHHGQPSLVPSPNATYDKLPERLRAYASPSK